MGMYEGLALELKDQVIAALKQALAEKDREIAAMMAHNAALGQSLSNTLQREKVLMDENEQLMAQAVLFAKTTISDMVTEGTIKKAQAFLKEHS